MRGAMGHLVLTAAAIVLSVVLGCGGAKMDLSLPELGLSMHLPSGWTVDGQNPRMFFDARNREDNYGLVEDYPLEGLSFEEYVASMPTGGATIVSKKPTIVSGHEAMEVVSEALYTVIEVNIHKGDRVIRVSFRALKDDYPEHEPSYRESLRSIAIK